MAAMKPRPDDHPIPSKLRRRLQRLWRVDLGQVRLRQNPRLRRLARFLARKHTIELKQWPPADDAVLIHELAHAAAVKLHGPRIPPHGREWRALIDAAKAAGLLPETRERPQPRTAKPSERRYEHTCPVCQFSRTAKRAVTTWRCPDCLDAGLGGELAIVRTR